MADEIKQKIARALEELLSEKPLERVTIGELAARCGLSRQGFYYHFHDLYEVVEWRAAQLAVECVRTGVQDADLETAIVFVARRLSDNRATLEKMLASPKMRSAVSRTLIETIVEYLRPLLTHSVSIAPLCIRERDFFAELLACGLAGVVTGACGNDFSPEYAARQIRLLIEARAEYEQRRK